MTDIILKQGTGVPSDTDLEVAEVAIDSSTGDMYTKLADGSVKQLNEGGASDWGSITGKPTEFPPASHNHDGVYQPVGDYIEDANSDGKQYARQDGAWSEIAIPEASNTLEGTWAYNSSSAAEGAFTTRNANWLAATTVTLHKTDSAGFEHNFALMADGDIIYIQAPDGGAEYEVVSKTVSGDTCEFLADAISHYGTFPSNGDSTKINFIPQVSAGANVTIGPNPPDPVTEGMQWLETPPGEQATMWIYDGAKWLQHPSGKDGAPGADGADGNIADATEQGVVATWDDTAKQWTPEGSVTVDASGFFYASSFATNSNNFGNISFFGDTVNQQGVYVGLNGGGDFDINNRDGGEFHYLQNNVRKFTIDATGDATFSGNVDADAVSFAGYCGFRTASGTDIVPTDGSGGATSNTIDLGSSSYKFKDAFFSGTVNAGAYEANGAGCKIWSTGAQYWRTAQGPTNTGDAYRLYANDNTLVAQIRNNGQFVSTGSPLTRTRDLIETLHTLREATKDEITIEGLRDAIGNAVGGLIEKFEAMQTASTQEISDE